MTVTSGFKLKEALFTYKFADIIIVFKR